MTRRLSDQSAGALLAFAAMLLIVSGAVISPAGTFAFASLAGLVSLVPLVFGSTKRRVLAAVILVVSVLLVVPAYSKHQSMVEAARGIPHQRQ